MTQTLENAINLPEEFYIEEAEQFLLVRTPFSHRIVNAPPGKMLRSTKAITHPT
ncbi:hypothetical protein [Nostoc sp.]|uniref:hypothetical protein n=1 Tax=Nostoc sp. TaxID=1180 RepID=UPI002FF90468